MLTGESVPVSKTPLERTQLLYEELGPNQKGLSNFSPELTRSLLFSGTQIIRARSGFAPSSAGCERNFRAVAMVIRTGFNTTKGGLVRSILFPRPSQFKFYRDSFRFIGVSAVIALVGFFVTLAKLISLGMTPYLITIRTLDLTTVIIPPALPATMSIGVSFALSRLQANGVYCISPTRINVSGKVDIVCFDKTGTLTEEGLDVLGAQDVAGNHLESLLADVSTLTITQGSPLSLLHCLASCHGIKVVDNERLGDPLDLRMLESTRWILEEGGAPAVGKPSSQLVAALVRPPNQPRFSLDTLQNLRKAEDFQELAILHTFEFVSSLRRMSVVVKKWRSQVATLYTKGAPEVIATLCRPESLPKDFSTQLKAYTQKGYRVIACAGRDLGELSWPQIQSIDQAEAETNLTFLGFVVFENRLKAATPAAIAALRQAEIRQVMCTGDNPLTAVSVAFECGLIPQGALVFSPKLQGSSILWESINHDSLGHYSDAPLLLNPDTLQPPTPHGSNYAIAVTGDCFRQIMDNSPQHVIDFMLTKAHIFARMSPEEKQELVEKLHELDYCVCFCGDGANDCGALRAADVGLSLSEAEASVAAPFTSKTLDISSVPLLIREGRAALVTSFSCFKYMGLYSIIQSTTIMFLYQYGSNLGDNQFLAIDLLTILPIAVAMGRTGASSKLYPGSPSASLVSKKMLSSFLGQCLLQILVQLIVYLVLVNQDWFVVPEFNAEDPNVPSMINTTLFHLSSFQYIWGALVFSVGHPFRRPMYTNIPFIATSVILTAFYLWILLAPIDVVVEQFELVPIKQSFRYFILAFVIGNLAFSYIYEQYLASLVVVFIKGAQRTFLKLNQSRHRTGFCDHFDLPKKRFQQVEREDQARHSA
ncbi:hypothetical protein DSO57_1010851 [Entomophthora muscae]|uniref:Uncharacterized protein n=1 Tax=Entomophthora muscae TaxID=34485 RepID=A0ACC2RXH5_9FUNG|nr:hypothetical protein DSO57_1010851 [Entomophthora muscae]